MDSEHLKVCLSAGIEYVVTWPNDEMRQNLIKLITDTNIKRAIMNDERCTFQNILNKVVTTKKYVPIW